MHSLRERVIFIPIDMNYRNGQGAVDPMIGIRFPALQYQTILCGFSNDDFINVVRHHPNLIHLVIGTRQWKFKPAHLFLHRIGQNQSVLRLKFIWRVFFARAFSKFKLEHCLPMLRCMPSLQHIDFCIQWCDEPLNHLEIIEQRFTMIRTFLREEALPLCPDLVQSKLLLESFRYNPGGTSKLLKEECFKLNDA